MKKVLYSTILCSVGLFGYITTTAQIQEGNLIIGANLAHLDIGLQDGASVNFQINPRLGYFIQDNMALGGLVKLGVDYAKNRGTNVTYSVGAFGRYYLGDKKYQLLKHTRFFGEGNAGLAGSNTKVSGSSSITTNGLELGIGPGIAYFITPNIGLEVLPKYSLTAGFGSSATVNKLSLEVGLQIYLSTKRARAMYSELSDEIKQKTDD